MPELYPLTFEPLFQERIWGGRSLERLFGKKLPVGPPIGESWEISDRPGAESVIKNGPLAGRTLTWLMQSHSEELMGEAAALHGRFPLLVKILDARDRLSLQVHPPAARARELGGDPKTEIWYIVEAEPGAELYVGLKKGASREEFEAKIESGRVQECFHRLPVKAGDAMFLPSGRVHAIGAGLVIFEIQQNSDTTYRVYDWDRRDASGKPRDLHVEQSLKCIDFSDFEPSLASEKGAVSSRGVQWRALVRDPLFDVSELSLPAREALDLSSGKPQILAVVTGKISIPSDETPVTLSPGEFCLFPASLKERQIHAEGPSRLLLATPG